MQAFVFQPEPRGGELVANALAEFLQRSPAARVLERRLRADAGVRLADAVDVLSVQGNDELRSKLGRAGFVALEGERRVEGAELWEHPGGLFPLFELRAETARRLFVRVESVVDFLES